MLLTTYKDTSLEVKTTIIEELIDCGGQEIICLDLRDIEDTIADYFIICHANSATQAGSIAHYVSEKVKKVTGEVSFSSEGKKEAQWIILDYVDNVVHVFCKLTREYYQLEHLWSDAPLSHHSEDNP